MDKHQQLRDYIARYPDRVSNVVDFHPGTDRFYEFDFTDNNTELTIIDLVDTNKFGRWIDHKLQDNDCRFGIGGYMEHRTIYGRSNLFDGEDEPRRLHLGIDLWAPAGTAVYSPLAGRVHSFQDNNHFGDYGPTIILEHDLDGLTLYTLYGHLSRKSLEGLVEGQSIESAEKIAELGEPYENGNWPPHLHFQLMFDLEGNRGDYPGVGRFSQMKELTENIPDPGIILQIPDATIIR